MIFWKLIKVLISELFDFVSQPTHTHSSSSFSRVAQARDFHEGITTDEQRRQTDSMQVQHVDKSQQPQLLSLIISSSITAFLAVLRSTKVRFNSWRDTRTTPYLISALDSSIKLSKTIKEIAFLKAISFGTK